MTTPSSFGTTNPSSGPPLEPVRHKLLDLVGDLAVAGCALKIAIS
jgi:hypothetical protein